MSRRQRGNTPARSPCRLTCCSTSPASCPKAARSALETSDNRMTVKAGRSRFQLPTLPRDDFPVIVEGDLPTSVRTARASTLAELIDRTRFAISTEETRYYLNGIFLHVSDEDQPVLKAAATDGHRLARFTIAAPRGRSRDARRDRAAKGRGGAAQAARGSTRRQCRDRPVGQQDPLHAGRRGRGGADQQADRRHLPRLQPRDPDRQRQAPEARPAQLLRRRGPRRHHCHREDPRGQDGPRQGQA